MTKIPFIDLSAQQRLIKDKIDRRIQDILKHGKYILGPEVSELEEKLAEFCGAKYAITCANGTDALSLALMAYGVRPGDAVFTTPFTFIATAEVISLLGATPVFVDVEEESRNIDPKKLEEKIVELKKNSQLKIKGIIPVDLFGLPADYREINRIAKDNDLFVLEDAAQAFGAFYYGKRTCNLTDIAATSFFPAKPLGCYGDGGAVFTNNEKTMQMLKSIRVHGQGTNKYENVRIGLNSRLDTFQAAILIEKLAIFEEELRKRSEVAADYTRRLKDSVKTPEIPEGCTSAWAQYSFLADDRDAIQKRLKDAGIPTVVYYPIPLHLQSAFACLRHKKGDFPVSEMLSEKILCLPMHPYLSLNQIEMISRTIQGCF